MAEISIRFGIKTDCGKRASTWKCFAPKGVGKSDLYILNRAMGSTIKTSLHESGKYHTAFISKYFNEKFTDAEKDERGRFVDKWSKPNELAEGLTVVFRIVTPFSSATADMSEEKHKKTFWIQNAPENMATEVVIIITKPDVLISSWPAKNSMGTELIGKLKLDNGNTVWFIYMYTEMPQFPENMSGKMRHSNGKPIEEIKDGNLKAIMFGDNPDGSKVIYDLAYSCNGN
jgi:hypothetical protein